MIEDKKKMSKEQSTTSEVKDDGVTKTNSTKTAKQLVKVTPSPMITKEVTTLPALTQAELATLDYADFSTPARMMALAEVLCKSKLSPLKKKEDVVMALMTGQELGLPFVTSLSQIYPINDRPTLGVHIQKALCLKNGVVFEKIEDAVQIYSFVIKEGEKLVPAGEGTIEQLPKDGKKKEIDRRTTYLFTREIRMASGGYKTITAKGSFSLREATEADLVGKDVWIKYWRRMLDARAFTNGAREIADDIILGLMTPNELSNDFYVNEQGTEVHKVEVI